MQKCFIYRYECTFVCETQQCQHAGPKAWNALPAELQDLADHSAFKRQLKTFLFERAFTA